MTADFWAIAMLAIAGLAVGSFLNVCIYRLPKHVSIVAPRSRCGACGHQLAWFENVPLVSYAVLRARCRACGARISPIYPIVESITAIVFVGLYLWYGPTILLAIRILFTCAMIVLFMTDLREQVLPNAITVPGIPVGFLLSALFGSGWQSSLAGIAIGGGVLWAIGEVYYRVRGEEGLGMGDVKMLAMIGAFLGWQLVLVTLVLASLVGSIVGVAIMLARRESMRYAIPFGTFLAAAALVAAVAGDAIVAWYVGLYQIR